AQTNPAVKALQNVTRTLPIVFLQVSDPVGAGFVRSLSHPGGNITGFTNFEVEIGGKWLQTLKDIGPAVENVGFVFNQEPSAHNEFLRAGEKASGALNVKIVPLAVHKAEEVDSAITGFASVPKGGMIVSPHPITRGKLLLTLPHAIGCRPFILLTSMSETAG